MATAQQNHGVGKIPNTTIGPGATGVAVKELQARLIKLGFRLDSTGVYDPPTEAIIRTIQQRSKLPVTGVYGFAESERINHVLLQVQGGGIRGVGADVVWTPETQEVVPATAAAPVAIYPTFSQLATWQKGMIVLGGIAVAAGAFWVFNNWSKSWSTLNPVPAPGSHHCPRVPGADVFERGTVLQPGAPS